MMRGTVRKNTVLATLGFVAGATFLIGLASRAKPTAAQGVAGPGCSALSLCNQVAALTAQVNTLQSNVTTLQSNVATLQANVAMLGGTISPAELVGNYAFVGFQNELVPFVLNVHPAHVASYVFTGTATLNSDFTGSATQTQTGTTLFQGTWSVRSADQGPDTFGLTWTYSNGVLSVTINTKNSNPVTPFTVDFNVSAGGSVLTHASANPPPPTGDGTDVLLVLTRLNLPLQ